MNARPFDPQWTTDNQALIAYLDRLCADLTAKTTGKRKRRRDAQPLFEAAINAIVLDLYRANQSDPTLEVGIGTGTTALQRKSKSRYGASFISARTFIDAMEALQRESLIVLSTPHWDDPEKKRSRVARYMATTSLLCGIDRAGASVADLRRHRNAEGIRLKDGDKRLVDYGDNAFANARRDRLRIINDMLEGQWADLALTDAQLAAELTHISGQRDDEAAQSFDFAARTVHRVFNNYDWKQGGRFYGAWWTSCPSRLRPYILINGKRTVEVDYSGLHAAMLYAQDGQPIPDDPYERCLTKVGNKAERKLVKQTFNALLNAESVDRIGEIDDYSPEITGRCWHDFKQYVVSKYPEFSQHFGSGVGLFLQRKDSDLAETVMLRFAAMRYACLPVHDSFIVHHGLQDDLDQIMREAFQAEFGISGKVGIDIGIGEVVEGSDLPIEADPDQLLHPEGYEARLQAFWDKRNMIEEAPTSL
ncbi:hypothetical protein J7354_14690 [Sulfitobacter sp. R18_2]|uniref:hypothetical protein n=1 Tax=Sulfitobacter sp. R18_2 TaxID=2821105 RepID=UPI001ADA8101|nr:hypothetical protein [Sulfitobacter sp. R18_2]MBO9439916.1 hypothetical protein [Sulfitobacter sp. R18_2]